jgi:Holliday junction resolvase RusA-like endonuclease
MLTQRAIDRSRATAAGNLEFLRRSTASGIERAKPAKGAKPAKKELKKLPPIELFIDATIVAQRCSDSWRRLVLPYPVSVNRMYEAHKIGKFARVHLSKEAKRYQKLVEHITLATGQRRPIVGRVEMMIDLYRERNSGDADPLKLLFDCLEGVFYENDRQIRRYLPEIMPDDPAFPRVELRVRLCGGETLNFEEFLK